MTTQQPGKQFRDDLSSSFFDYTQGDLSFHGKKLDYIHVNPYLWIDKDQADMSVLYTSYFQMSTQAIKPYYEAFAGSKNDLQAIGINTRIGLCKFFARSTWSTEYKRINFTRDAIILEDKELSSIDSQASRDCADSKMIAACFQLSIFNTLLILQELLNQSDASSFDLNDQLMLVYIMYHLCPTYSERTAGDVAISNELPGEFERLNSDLSQADQSRVKPKNDYLVDTNQGITSFYSVNPETPIRNRLLDALSTAQSISDSGMSSQLVLGELYDSEGDIDSFGAREANAKIDNINSRLISKACGWLITRLRQAKSSKKTYQNVSMLMQLDNAYMLSLINQNNQEVKINNKLLSSSTSIRMLLDLAGTAISSNNLFFFDDYKNDFYKLFKLLDPDYLISKKAKQDNSIKDLDGLKQLIRNCFSTARVLIDESVKKLQLRLHQSDLIRLKVIPHSIAGSGDQPKSPLYKEICYLELYKPAFDRIYQGDSLAQLASKRLSLVSQRIARLNDKKELDLSKMEDLLELTRQSTLDSVGQAVSELDKIGIRLDSMLDMFERIDLEYCKMYQELGRLAFGNDGLSYIITILSLRDALRKVPVLGSFMSKDSPTLEQFIAELDATRPRLNQASLSTNEGISKNLDALGLALNVATQNPKKRDLIRILTDSSSQKTSIYSKLGRVISRINRLDEISVQEGFRSNKQLNGTLGSAGQIAAATISRGAVGLSLSLGALLVLSASGIFIVCLFLFTKELRAFLASGLNFGVMGQILQQEKAYERTQELISQIAATSDQESKKQLTDLLNVVHSSFKESSNLVLEGLEIQMRKPSIFDAPGILAVNAAYVAVGLFAVWGTARIYFMAKEKQGKLDSK